jgi:hypothetical protein
MPQCRASPWKWCNNATSPVEVPGPAALLFDAQGTSSCRSATHRSLAFMRRCLGKAANLVRHCPLLFPMNPDAANCERVWPKGGAEHPGCPALDGIGGFGTICPKIGATSSKKQQLKTLLISRIGN